MNATEYIEIETDSQNVRNGVGRRVHHKLIKVNFAIGFCITVWDMRRDLPLYGRDKYRGWGKKKLN